MHMTLVGCNLLANGHMGIPQLCVQRWAQSCPQGFGVEMKEFTSRAQNVEKHNHHGITHGHVF